MHKCTERIIGSSDQLFMSFKCNQDNLLLFNLYYIKYFQRYSNSFNDITPSKKVSNQTTAFWNKIEYEKSYEHI